MQEISFILSYIIDCLNCAINKKKINNKYVLQLFIAENYAGESIEMNIKFWYLFEVYMYMYLCGYVYMLNI